MSEIKLQKIKFPGLNNTYTIPIPEEVTSIEHGGTGATTAEEARSALGAAPAGYVSERGFAATYAEWYEGIQRVFNEMPDNSKKVVTFGLGAAGEIPRGSWLVELNRFYAEYGFIKIRNEVYPDGIILSINYTWGEWEYVNPPMQVGVEYRTTERYLGYPVYCYVLDFGTPADGKTMELPNKDSVYCIKLIARTLYTCGTGVTGAYTPGAIFSSGNVSLRIVDSTLEGNSSYPVQVIAYYYRP